ncbi:glutamate ABC transporter substrate-binding protein [Corynebacterium cystitidis]|uniref:glutamate ABC transporter substrate-binding protein n=1 Tax=Corynebacterium cystitidis TaxID=35757 RepID=UPI00211EA918|nr:glutamate ABC transporter substrate-binding protein [Corynebacterium cystitidis]
MRRSMCAVLAGVLVGTLTLTSCVADAPSAPPEPLPVNRAGPPLPAGSRLEPADATPPEPEPDEKPYGSLRPDDATPQERIPEVYERGRLIVGVDQSQYLLSFRDPVSGDLEGFEVDLSREIANDIFGAHRPVDFRFVDSADRAAALQEGRVDIVIRTMTITRPRQNVVAFSAPYLDANLRLLVPRGSGISTVDSVGDGTLCVADGSTAVNTARAEAPNAQLLMTTKWADCLLALQQFQADAVLADDTILSGMAAQDPSTTIVSLPLERQAYGVGVALGNDGMVRQVNSTLERIRRDGTWWDMYNQWFGPYLHSQGPPQLTYREEEPDDE